MSLRGSEKVDDHDQLFWDHHGEVNRNVPKPDPKLKPKSKPMPKGVNVIVGTGEGSISIPVKEKRWVDDDGQEWVSRTYGYDHEIIEKAKELVPLVDENAKDKKGKWSAKKKETALLGQAYIDHTKQIWDEMKQETNEVLKSKLMKEHQRVFNKGQKISSCASYLSFQECVSKPNEHPKRFRGGNLCNTRLCPFCSWRKSLRTAARFAAVAHALAKRRKVRWIFLTLTVQNVQGSELNDTLKKMLKAWKRLSELKRFEDSILGWYRSIEVTRNGLRWRKNRETGEKEDNPWFDTYHPHIHVILAVDPKYFKGQGKYISKDEFAEMWKQSLRVDYTPTCDVRIIKNKRNRDAEKQLFAEMENEISDAMVVSDKSYVPPSAIAEIAKYPAKFSSVLGEKDPRLRGKAVAILDKALAHKHLTSYGGLLKEIDAELDEKIGEESDLEQDQEECKCSVCQSDMLEVLYNYMKNHNDYMKSVDKKRQKKDLIDSAQSSHK